MKSLPTLIGILLLMISSQAYAEGYVPLYNFQPYVPGSQFVPAYQPQPRSQTQLYSPPTRSQPQPYKDPMADFRKQQQMQAIADQSRAYRAMETEALNRMGAAHACSFITGNDTARRQCYSEIK